MSKTVKASSVDIIMESKKYVAKMDEIMKGFKSDRRGLNEEYYK